MNIQGFEHNIKKSDIFVDDRFKIHYSNDAVYLNNYPVLVKKVDNRFLLIDGIRRFYKFDKFDIIIVRGDDRDLFVEKVFMHAATILSDVDKSIIIGNAIKRFNMDGELLNDVMRVINLPKGKFVIDDMLMLFDSPECIKMMFYEYSLKYNIVKMFEYLSSDEIAIICNLVKKSGINNNRLRDILHYIIRLKQRGEDIYFILDEATNIEELLHNLRMYAYPVLSKKVKMKEAVLNKIKARGVKYILSDDFEKSDLKVVVEAINELSFRESIIHILKALDNGYIRELLDIYRQ